MNPKDWQILEGRVRRVASYIWDAEAQPEQINGVNIDAVLKREPDYWVCVEVSTSTTLDKLREDLAKFSSIRPFLQSQGIHVKCVFVSASDPPPSLKQTGEGSNVTVLSIEELERSFFDFGAYESARRLRPFGSAVNPISGEKDESAYVPVKYVDETDESFTVSDIAARLLIGQKLILLGEYGTGKSRCFRELFTELARRAIGAGRFPIAIDLRENWGTRRGHEIIRRHFDEMGLGAKADAIVKVYDQGNLIYLLDGFDEIGSQAWSDDQNKLRNIRSQSLSGVRDLLSNTKAGAIISGRAHYFNTDEEMFAALGLKKSDALVLRCKDEFTKDEMEQFLSRISHDLVLPTWLPKRPLICQTIANLDEDDLDQMFQEDGGDVAFWHRLIDVICEREARIAAVLDPASIKNVLRHLARSTRSKPANVGPLSTTEVNKAFEAALGFQPVDESAMMLQRLPALGRLTAESSDRQFIDVYILDGLRGLDVSHTVKTPRDGCENDPWSNPLQPLGQAVAASDIHVGTYENKSDAYIKHAKKCAAGRNKILASDIVASLADAGSPMGLLDYKGVRIADGHFTTLDFTSSEPSNLTIIESFIEDLYLPAVRPVGCEIARCVITAMHRVSSAQGVPDWIKEPTVERFETVSTVSQIKAADLTPSQRILITMIKKTFFQKGSGRKEEALIRGLGATRATADPGKVLNLLIREKVLETHKGSGGGGTIYSPNRALAARMRQMISELTLSKDPIWQAVSNLKS